MMWIIELSLLQFVVGWTIIRTMIKIDSDLCNGQALIVLIICTIPLLGTCATIVLLLTLIIMLIRKYIPMNSNTINKIFMIKEKKIMKAELTRNLIKSFECMACKHDNGDGEDCRYCTNLSKFEMYWEIERELRELENCNKEIKNILYCAEVERKIVNKFYLETEYCSRYSTAVVYEDSTNSKHLFRYGCKSKLELFEKLDEWYKEYIK